MMIPVLIGIVGACMGSFFTVLIPRLAEDKPGILFGRSMCADTGKPLRWYELVPVFSYIAQGGRSRHSGERLSLFYPLVELITAAACVTGYLAGWQSSTDFPYYLVTLFAVLLGAYDAKYGLVDRRITIPAIALAALWAFFRGVPAWEFFVGGGIGAAWFGVQYFLSKGTWVGQGDIDLGLLLGLVVGLEYTLFTLFGAYFLGVMGIALAYSITRSQPKKIAFGPYIMLSTWVFFLWGDALSDAYWALVL